MHLSVLYTQYINPAKEFKIWMSLVIAQDTLSLTPSPYYITIKKYLKVLIFLKESIKI